MEQIERDTSRRIEGSIEERGENRTKRKLNSMREGGRTLSNR